MHAGCSGKEGVRWGPLAPAPFATRVSQTAGPAASERRRSRRPPVIAGRLQQLAAVEMPRILRENADRADEHVRARGAGGVISLSTLHTVRTPLSTPIRTSLLRSLLLLLVPGYWVYSYSCSYYDPGDETSLIQLTPLVLLCCLSQGTHSTLQLPQPGHPALGLGIRPPAFTTCSGISAMTTAPAHVVTARPEAFSRAWESGSRKSGKSQSGARKERRMDHGRNGSIPKADEAAWWPRITRTPAPSSVVRHEPRNGGSENGR